ncbi:PX domain-containing protein [Sodiomyces alkalinus F11]|uniref:Sorting nexin MVP1 n=1 Tax=Sodiomyces alkalinus (strain CBS 110278 / VKM F-3762 / F11) TaxID=1314773 RepID=A0A3N2PUD0_SODAK|nr:PX domain-containing protein [Sodiomyces alkalinus F11]ROT38092.1 PX domain-containing protein [Sodiomyces alkalinus F11]
MSLFGSSPGESPSSASPAAPSRSLFDDEAYSAGKSASNSLFADDDFSGDGSRSPWDMPTPRKQQSLADLIRTLLPASDSPDSYIDAFDRFVHEDGADGKVASAGVTKLFEAAELRADQQDHIMSIVRPSRTDVAFDRAEFNVVLALVGLAQEGEAVSLDGVDERRRNLPKPKLAGQLATPAMPPTSELAAKPPQSPASPASPAKQQQHERHQQHQPLSPSKPQTIRRPPMEFPETDDPWGSPGAHKHHNHPPMIPQANGPSSQIHSTSHGATDFPATENTTIAGRTLSSYTAPTVTPGTGSIQPPTETSVTSPAVGDWGYFEGNSPGGGFVDPLPGQQAANPFGGNGNRGSTGNAPDVPALRPAVSRTGHAVEEIIVVTLMPEKEGLFFFQHHNYEVSSVRRGSKVIRRYSDFVWLLDCLHKRYPFRALPLLPPKRVAVNGNHLSNDGAFIEKRRRGLGRFLNALVRHPVLGQEQLVIMFLTVPTELAVWRKQATISVQDEFAGRALPPGLEDSLPPTLEELFNRTRAGVRRSSELYINVCTIMDRLVKRTEGVAADHARIALSLQSLTEASNDTYATDTNDVPLLNDGLTATSKHLRTCQSLLEDESKAWDAGVLEDLKRQRDTLVSIRDMFERRDRLDKDNIPYLERRIQTNETKLANLRNKPEGMVKPGEVEKVVEAIIKDKESIVSQHNRSVFVKECIRDELLYFQSSQYHVSRWNQDWAQERVKYSEMLADNWRRLLDELDGMPLGD